MQKGLPFHSHKEVIMYEERISYNKETLLDLAHSQFGGFYNRRMDKENFLQDLWSMLASFTRYNKCNSLIQSAVLNLEHSDLIPRTFLILSIQYGSFHLTPSRISILKDFIGLLDKDFEDEELRVCAYAHEKTFTFFPELYQAWQNIREVYGAEEFNLSVLPPTPYYAYHFLALNRRGKMEKNPRGAELFGELCAIEHQMEKLFLLTTPL